MSYRCINAFMYADRVYPGGIQVSDGDPILKTHAAHFARVEVAAPFTETATATPGETRTTVAPKQEPPTDDDSEPERPRRGRPSKQTSATVEEEK